MILVRSLRLVKLLTHLQTVDAPEMITQHAEVEIAQPPFFEDPKQLYEYFSIKISASLTP